MITNSENFKFFLRQIPYRIKTALLEDLPKYKRTLKYLYKKYGLRRAYNFLWVKLFVKECGPAIINPLWSAFPEWAPYPTHIELEVTTKCHLKCAICEQRYWKETPQNISWDNFVRIINQFPNLKWIGLAGIGTNFCHPDFVKMLKFLKDRNIFVEFVDHLDLMTEEKTRAIVEMGVDRIWISIDGAKKETYEGIKVGTSFERMTDHLKTLIRIKKELNSPLPELFFRFVATKQNIHEAPDFVDMIASLGKREDFGDGSYIEIAGLLYFNEISDDYYLAEIPQTIKDEVLRRAKAAGITVAFSHSHPTRRRPRHFCAAWVEPFIFVTGEVNPCCAQNEANQRELQRKNSLGNIFEKPFKEIWYSEKYKSFRRNMPDYSKPVPDYCKDCRVTNMNELPADRRCDYDDCIRET